MTTVGETIRTGRKGTALTLAVMLEDAVRIGELRAEQDGDLPACGRLQVWSTRCWSARGRRASDSPTRCCRRSRANREARS